MALEEHYGFQLFSRLPKGLALTVEGEILLPVVTESCYSGIGWRDWRSADKWRTKLNLARIIRR